MLSNRNIFTEMEKAEEITIIPQEQQQLIAKKYEETLKEIEVILDYAKEQTVNFLDPFLPVNLRSLSADSPIETQAAEAAKNLTNFINKLNTQPSIIPSKSVEISGKEKIVYEQVSAASIANDFIGFMVSYLRKLEDFTKDNPLKAIDVREKRELFLNRLDIFPKTPDGKKLSREDIIDLQRCIINPTHFPVSADGLPEHLKDIFSNIHTLAPNPPNYDKEKDYQNIRLAILEHHLTTLKGVITHTSHEEKKNFILFVKDKVEQGGDFDQLKHKVLELKTYVLLMGVIHQDKKLLEGGNIPCLDSKDRVKALQWLTGIITNMNQNPSHFFDVLHEKKESAHGFFSQSHSEGIHGVPRLT